MRSQPPMAAITRLRILSVLASSGFSISLRWSQSSKGFKAYPTTRFATAEGGGEEFVIWPEGAAKYYAQIIDKETNQ
mgnify:CR=1 FL=1